MPTKENKSHNDEYVQQTGAVAARVHWGLKVTRPGHASWPEDLRWPREPVVASRSQVHKN